MDSVPITTSFSPLSESGMTQRPSAAAVLLLTYTLLAPRLAIAAGDLTWSLGARRPTAEGSETQAGISFDLSAGGKQWPVHPAGYVAGFMTRSQNVTLWPPNDDFISGKRRVITTELGVGITRTWTVGSFSPYLAGGVCRVNVLWKDTGTYVSYEAAHEASGSGGWVNAGGFWRLGSGLRFGAGARLSKAKVQDYAVGGTQIVLRVGKEWGWR